MKIEIPGIPISQARMKHSNRRGFVTTYDPKAKEKASIRKYLEAYRSDIVFHYPRINFLFYMPIPSSVPKKELQEYQSGRLKHPKKPDVDNLIKLYLDCLDGIIIQGDQKVSLGYCIKLYSINPRTFIEISESNKLLSNQELESLSNSSQLN